MGAHKVKKEVPVLEVSGFHGVSRKHRSFIYLMVRTSRTNSTICQLCSRLKMASTGYTLKLINYFLSCFYVKINGIKQKLWKQGHS